MPSLIGMLVTETPSINDANQETPVQRLLRNILWTAALEDQKIILATTTHCKAGKVCARKNMNGPIINSYLALRLDDVSIIGLARNQ
nr:hypothetical protein CFP56_71321 [Quercus suber]